MNGWINMAYETFAFIYDEVMDETLYQQWLAFSKRHLQEDTKIFWNWRAVLEH